MNLQTPFRIDVQPETALSPAAVVVRVPRRRWYGARYFEPVALSPIEAHALSEQLLRAAVGAARSTGGG